MILALLVSIGQLSLVELLKCLLQILAEILNVRYQPAFVSL